MLYIIILTFISISLIYYIILKLFVFKTSHIGRLKRYTNVEHYYENVTKKKGVKIEYKSGLNVISKKIGNAKFLDGYKKSLQKKLISANILLKAEEFITLTLGLVFIVSVLVLIITANLFMALLAGGISYVFPGIILKAKIKKRVKQLNDQLGDAIALISNSLKAGYSFIQAVDTVSEEMTGPISEEFKVMKKEISFGLSTEAALEKLSERISSDDLDLMITAVMIQRQIGGNLAEILDNISTTIRERVKIKGEIKTLTAQGRMSGIVISLLPPIMFLILYFINSELMSILFKDPVGLVIIIGSIFMEFLGIIAIKKIVNIQI